MPNDKCEPGTVWLWRNWFTEIGGYVRIATAKPESFNHEGYGCNGIRGMWPSQEDAQHIFGDIPAANTAVLVDIRQRDRQCVKCGEWKIRRDYAACPCGTPITGGTRFRAHVVETIPLAGSAKEGDDERIGEG